MKKLFSMLLASVMLASLAISANAGSAVEVGNAGIFTYDESDGEYWSPTLYMLDKTGTVMALEDGTIVGYSDVSTYTDAAGVQNMDTLQSGWYEVVLCNLGTNPEWFPAEVEGKVALCVRGDSTFTVKSENAMNAGAIACLIGNNCRAVELVDETGTMTGEYENVSMSVDYYTIPMCALSSDVTARLVAATADISIADAVVAVEDVYFGDLELSVSHAKSAYIFLGTLEEYAANTTRTDANTVTAGGGVGEAAATTETATETAAEATTSTASIEIVPQDYPSSSPIEDPGEGYATLEEAAAAIGKTAISGYTFVVGTNSFANEGPEKLWDNDTATKFCANEFPTISIAELDGEYAIDGIIMATANDNAEYNNRSPYEWAVYGSNDGATWTALAYGDDYFFEETNFTYYAAPLTTEGTYKYVMFQSEGGLSGTFQVSEVVLTGAKVEAAAAVEEVAEEPVAEEPVVEEAVVVEETPAAEETVEETVVEEAVVEETVEAAAEEAAQTFDFGVIAAVVAALSAAGYAISKKR